MVYSRGDDQSVLIYLTGKRKIQQEIESVIDDQIRDTCEGHQPIVKHSNPICKQTKLKLKPFKS